LGGRGEDDERGDVGAVGVLVAGGVNGDGCGGFDGTPVGVDGGVDVVGFWAL